MFRKFSKVSLLCLTVLLIVITVITWRKGPTFHRKGRAVIPNNAPKTILVTGAAGFIGFHLAKILSTNAKNKVIAMDNFNDYYDVRLKIDRAYELHRLGIPVYKEDVCNEAFLDEMFVRYNFTHVAHMAAQAGVRYSLENPQAYIRANIQCQIALIDTIKQYPSVKLIYASSSSVYGKESSIPFRLDANTDHPGNMYAATKKTDELLGYHYCHAYDLHMVGLRFFTVYGPWGRPDMAVFKFAEAIFEGKGVPMFHVDGDKELGRDFTYVDDVVAGIIAALDYVPASCGERFNLGFGNPVSVPEMLKIIEKEMDVPAKINKLPLPPSEILQTWADISTSTEYLNFQPKTNLSVGVSQFISWYKAYRKQRKEEKTPTPSEIWYSQLEDDEESRQKVYDKEHIRKHNEALVTRIEGERDRYKKWAREHNIPVPDMTKGKFIFHKGMTSVKKPFRKEPNLKDNIAGLEAKCRQFDQCVAFTTDGALYKSLPPQQQWKKNNAFVGEKEGMYIADIDMCKSDLHDCQLYADCEATGPAQYKCHCATDFVDIRGQCVPRYGTPTPRELRWMYDAQAFEEHDLPTMKKAAGNMIFMQGMTSPAENYLIADQYANDHEKLQEICMKDALCAAITSDGVMKKKIVLSDKWEKTTDQSTGMFVFDINYCLLGPANQCSGGTKCSRMEAGRYACMSDFEILAVSQAEEQKKKREDENKRKEEELAKKEEMKKIEDIEANLEMSDSVSSKVLHVVYCLDEKDLEGLPNSMNSVAQSSSSVVSFHVIVCGRITAAEVNAYLRCFDFPKTMIWKQQNLYMVETAQCEGMVEVEAARYEQTLPTPSPSIRPVKTAGTQRVKIKVKVDTIDFDMTLMDEVYRENEVTQTALGYVLSCGNFARFFIASLLPQVDVAVYLDVDIVVKKDLNELVKEANKLDKLPLAFISRNVHYTYANAFKKSEVKDLYMARYGKPLNMDAVAFNAGLFVLNATQWRQEHQQIQEEIHYWMTQNKELSLFSPGTQALLQLVFHNRVQILQANPLYRDGLGYNENLQVENLVKKTILHWTGKDKPWDNYSAYGEVWAMFSPPQCAGHGICMKAEDPTEEMSWSCVCEGDYDGDNCQEQMHR